MRSPTLNVASGAISRKVCGFTLIEVVVTHLLISILAGLTVLAMDDGGDEREAVTQLDLLRNHIRYAQSMAMKERSMWGLGYDGSTFWVFDINGQRVLPGSDSPVNSVVTASPDPGGAVFFDMYGVPCSDNATTSPLITATTLTVTVGSVSETLTMIPDTGYLQ